MTAMKGVPEFPESFWRNSTQIEHQPSLEESITCDIGIVGGGITGITAAYLLTQQGFNVTLLEASELMNGTTGHTTGKITAQHGLIYDEFIQHFGQEKTRLYYEAQMMAKKMVEDLINKYQIKCDFVEDNAYIYTNSNEKLTSLEKEMKAYEQLGIQGELLDQIPLDIPIKSALVMKQQARFHPLHYLTKLVQESIHKGLNLYENTRAVDIEYSKHPTIITEKGHRVTCKHVIVASHYPFYDGEGFYPTRMYADRSYIIAIKTNQSYPGGMYINAETPTRSVRTVTMNEEELWLIAGENHKTGQGKSTTDEYYDALYQFADKQFGVKEYLYRWSAQDLTTLDKMPYIGPITKDQPSVLVATGFRKWGMSNGTIAAKIMSDTILDQENEFISVFHPSRFQADPSIRKFFSYNADVAKHLIKGKLDVNDANIDELASDEATTTRVDGKRVGVYKDTDHKLHIVDTTCTHLHCEVEWNQGERSWDCPCHGSRFTYTGEILEGPAKEPLTKIELE